VILFIEISRAAAAADLGMSGDKVTMRGVRASRGRDWNRLDRNRARNRQRHFMTGGLTRCTTRGQECPRHTSVLAATLFLECVYRLLGAVVKRCRAALGLDGRGRPSLHNRMGY